MASACTAASAATSASSAKVEPGLGKRLRLDQLLAPRLVKRPRPTLGLRDRLARLRLGLGGDEIGKTFDLGEIELARSRRRGARTRQARPAAGRVS